jgi:hypothetical protein
MDDFADREIMTKLGATFRAHAVVNRLARHVVRFSEASEAQAARVAGEAWLDMVDYFTDLYSAEVFNADQAMTQERIDAVLTDDEREGLKLVIQALEGAGDAAEA